MLGLSGSRGGSDDSGSIGLAELNLPANIAYPEHVVCCSPQHAARIEAQLQEKNEAEKISSLYACGLALQSIITVKFVFNARHVMLLDLSSNRLTSLGFSTLWAQLANLRIVYLHNNAIDDIGVIVEPLALVPSLRLLTVHGNPAGVLGARERLVKELPQLVCIDEHIIADVERINFTPAVPMAQLLSRFRPLCPSTYIGGRIAMTGLDHLKRAIPFDSRLLMYVVRQHAALSPAVAIQRVYRGFTVREAIRARAEAMRTGTTVEQRRLLHRDRRRRGAGGAVEDPVAHVRRVPRPDELASAFMVLKRCVKRWIHREALVGEGLNAAGIQSLVVIKAQLPYWCSLVYRLARVVASRNSTNVGINLPDYMTAIDSPLRILKMHTNPVAPEEVLFPVPRLVQSQVVLLPEPTARDVHRTPRDCGPLRSYCRSVGIDDGVAQHLRIQAINAQQHNEKSRREAEMEYTLRTAAASMNKSMSASMRGGKTNLLISAPPPRLDARSLCTIVIHNPQLMARLVNCARIHNRMRATYGSSMVVPFYLSSDVERVCATVQLQSWWRGYSSRRRFFHRIATKRPRLASRSDGRLDPEYRQRLPVLCHYATRLQAHWRCVLACRRARFLRQLKDVPTILQRSVEPGATATTAFISTASLLQILPPLLPMPTSAHAEWGSVNPFSSRANSFMGRPPSSTGTGAMLMSTDEDPFSASNAPDPMLLKPEAVRYDNHHLRFMAQCFPELDILRSGLELGINVNARARAAAAAHQASLMNATVSQRNAAVPSTTSLQPGLMYCGPPARYPTLPVYLRTAAEPGAETTALLHQNPIDIVLLDTELAYFVTHALSPLPSELPPGVEAAPAAAVPVASLGSPINAPSASSPQTLKRLMSVASTGLRRGGARSKQSVVGASHPMRASSVGSNLGLGASSFHGTNFYSNSMPTPVVATTGTREERLNWIRGLVQRHPDGYLAVKFASRREAASRRIALACLTYKVEDGSCVCFEPRSGIMRVVAAVRLQRWFRARHNTVKGRRGRSPPTDAADQQHAKPSPRDSAPVKSAAATTSSTRRPSARSAKASKRPQPAGNTPREDNSSDTASATITVACGRGRGGGDVVPSLLPYTFTRASVRRPLTASALREAIRRDGDDVVPPAPASAPTTTAAVSPNHQSADGDAVVGASITLVPPVVPSAAQRAVAAAESRQMAKVSTLEARQRAAIELRTRIDELSAQRRAPRQTARIVQQAVQLEIQGGAHTSTLDDETCAWSLGENAFLAPARVGSAIVSRPGSAALPLHRHAVEHRLDVLGVDAAPAWAAYARSIPSAAATVGEAEGMTTANNLLDSLPETPTAQQQQQQHQPILAANTVTIPPGYDEHEHHPRRALSGQRRPGSAATIPAPPATSRQAGGSRPTSASTATLAFTAAGVPPLTSRSNLSPSLVIVPRPSSSKPSRRLGSTTTTATVGAVGSDVEQQEAVHDPAEYDLDTPQGRKRLARAEERRLWQRELADSRRAIDAALEKRQLQDAEQRHLVAQRRLASSRTKAAARALRMATVEPALAQQRLDKALAAEIRGRRAAETQADAQALKRRLQAEEKARLDARDARLREKYASQHDDDNNGEASPCVDADDAAALDAMDDMPPPSSAAFGSPPPPRPPSSAVAVAMSTATTVATATTGSQQPRRVKLTDAFTDRELFPPTPASAAAAPSPRSLTSSSPRGQRLDDDALHGTTAAVVSSKPPVPTVFSGKALHLAARPHPPVSHRRESIGHSKGSMTARGQRRYDGADSAPWRQGMASAAAATSASSSSPRIVHTPDFGSINPFTASTHQAGQLHQRQHYHTVGIEPDDEQHDPLW